MLEQENEQTYDYLLSLPRRRIDWLEEVIDPAGQPVHRQRARGMPSQAVRRWSELRRLCLRYEGWYAARVRVIGPPPQRRQSRGA